AFIGRNGDAGKLRDDPAIGELIVKHDRVAAIVRLTNTAEALPERGNTRWAKQRRATVFVEHLEALVDHLHVLRRADFAVRIRRRAVATDAGKLDAVDIH